MSPLRRKTGKEMTDIKEANWKKKRVGIPTSSKLDALFTGGLRPATDEEIAIYKIMKSTRKTTPVEFGDTAIDYLYQLSYERESGIPTWTPSNRNFDWGNEQEIYAHKWLCANHPELNPRHCAGSDFDEIVFNIGECGLGDSPDEYFNDDAVGEIKCVMTGAKLKRLKEMSKEEAMQEYMYQFAGHLTCAPWAKKMIYTAYLGQNDEDENDILDPLAPERGITFEYDRSEFSDLITAIETKVKYVMAFLDAVDKGELKPDGKKLRIRDINEWQGVNGSR